MLWKHRLVIFVAVLTVVPSAAADDPEAEPDAPDWRRESEDLEERADKAEATHDLSTALELRQRALKIVRESRPGSMEVATALDEVGSTLRTSRPSRRAKASAVARTDLRYGV